MKTSRLYLFFRSSGLIISLLLLLASCSGSKRVVAEIKKDLNSSSAFMQSFTGLAVYDPQEQKMVLEYNSEKHFTPASNIKLYTFYAGLKTLGDSIIGLRYNFRNDSLFFQATGDPSLLNSDLPPSKVLDFLKSSEKKLFYVARNASETALGPGWAWDDYNAPYSVERSVLPVYGNKVIFKFGKNHGLPEVSPKQFSDSLLPKSSTFRRITRKVHRNHFQLPYVSDKDEQEIPLKTSEAIAIQLLQDTLHKRIEVLETSPGISIVKPLYSIPADSLYRQMLLESDNFIAEQILLLVAEDISDTLQIRIATNEIKTHYLQDLPDEFVWVDGSGLSRYNLTTPRNTVKLLEKIRREANYQRLFELLPQGGKSGTLKDQFNSHPAFIFAKTGSLSNNYSLSGYLLTKKGKILIFSFMNNNYVVPSAALKQEMERILINIRNSF